MTDLEPALAAALRGRFVVELELGRGGMGVVYLARDVALDRSVAIKVLPPQLADSPELRRRFLLEARTAARLAHPHIVPIHAVEEGGALIWIVMGYVPGSTLAERVADSGPLSATQVTRLTQEVAWALAYAHRHGVVHRDIKPENILIERGTERALVADFGIARAGQEAGDTPAGGVIGTARAMSPEQASGELVDGRSDLYSLGVTAFFALTGRYPFEAESSAGLLTAHLSVPAPPVLSVRPQLPRTLATAVDRCLAKQPDHRFENGEALAEALEADHTRSHTPPVLDRLAREITSFSVDLVGYATLAGVAGLAQILTASHDFMGMGQVYTVGIAVVLLSLTALKGLSTTRLLRDATRQGWTAHDFRQALLSRVKAEEAEGPPPPTRVRSGLLYLGGVALMLGFWLGPREYLIGHVSLGMFTGLLLELVAMVTPIAIGRWYGARLEAPRDGRPGFLSRVMAWKSGWMFKLLGRRGKKAAPRLPDARPTEVLLGEQAGAIFSALPKPERARLHGVEGIIGQLAARAAQLREREVELAQALAQVGTPGHPARDLVRHELLDEQQSVAAALGEALNALDTLRLDLLRLRAGTVTPEGMTEALDVVRQVGLDVDARMEALRKLP